MLLGDVAFEQSPFNPIKSFMKPLLQVQLLNTAVDTAVLWQLSGELHRGLGSRRLIPPLYPRFTKGQNVDNLFLRVDCLKVEENG